MRCTKCGNISWDHTSVCNACGQDLTLQMDQLGHFPQPEPGFSWFEGIQRKAADVKSTESPVDLSGIDVSDLVQKGEPAPPPTEDGTTPDIDLDEIEELVEDEELQEVLDKNL